MLEKINASIFRRFKHRYPAIVEVCEKIRLAKGEFIFLSSVAIIYIVSSIFQFGGLSLPPFLYVKTDDPEVFFLTVFQVQATVSTLGIAVIALISSLSSVQYYGIAVTRYIFDIKPKILKHRLLVIVSLSFVVVDYLFLSFALYDLVFATLLCSVVVCASMVSDVYHALNKGSNIKTDIRGFLQSNLNPAKVTDKWLKSVHRRFSLLSFDIEEKFRSRDYAAINDNLQVLEIIIGSYIQGLAAKRENKNFTASCEAFQIACRWTIESLLGSYEDTYLRMFIESLTSIYKRFTEIDAYIKIWQDVSGRFFEIMKVIDPTILLSDGCIRGLRLAIYGNITRDAATWECVIHFLPLLHHSLSGNKFYVELSESMKRQYWREFIIDDTDDYQDNPQQPGSLFRIQPRNDELYLLLRDAIDTMDRPLLSEVYPLQGDNRVVNVAAKAYLYCWIRIRRLEEDERYTSLLPRRRSPWYQPMIIMRGYFILCEEVSQYLMDPPYVRFVGQAMSREVLEFCLLYLLSIFRVGDDEEFYREWYRFMAVEGQRGRAVFVPNLGDAAASRHKIARFQDFMDISQSEEDRNAALAFYQARLVDA